MWTEGEGEREQEKQGREGVQLGAVGPEAAGAGDGGNRVGLQAPGRDLIAPGPAQPDVTRPLLLGSTKAPSGQPQRDPENCERDRTGQRINHATGACGQPPAVAWGTALGCMGELWGCRYQTDPLCWEGTGRDCRDRDRERRGGYRDGGRDRGRDRSGDDTHPYFLESNLELICPQNISGWRDQGLSVCYGQEGPG